jgi:tight adherence protein B
LVAALALLCFASALLLWQGGARKQRRLNTERFVERRFAAPGANVGSKCGSVAPVPGTHAPPAQGAAGAPMSMPLRANRPTSPQVQGLRAGKEYESRLPQALENFALRAGLSGARRLSMIAVATLAVGVVAIGLRAGVVAAGAATVALAAAVALFVTARSQRRRLAIVAQLPTFLDGIVRLVTLGNSVPAAFQAALQTTEAPLRDCLDHVSRMMRAGVEIDRALAHVAVVYRTREFEFVGAVLRLSVKYGGRADVMLERMSTFMRDLEQAGRELSAMSAETRLSAWVLVALPLLIGGFLVSTNPTYFTTMWGDADGRHLIYLSFALQAAGGYLLYRMTRLRA